MQTTYGLSARRTDRVLGLSRSARHYRPRPREDGPLIEAMQAHVAANPGHGFGLLHAIALKPHGWGKTRSWRVYRALQLNLPRRGKRRLPARIRDPLAVPVQANHTWSADFMADALWSGRRFRTFNVNDDFNRESLRIEVDTSLPSARVIRALDELVELRGRPTATVGQRSRVHQRGIEGLGPPPRRRSGPHPARQADPERLHRTLQPYLPHRSAGPLCVHQPSRGSPHDRGLAPPLQPPPPTSITGRTDTSGLRSGTIAVNLYF